MTTRSAALAQQFGAKVEEATSAQADLHRRLGQAPEAQAAYRKALSMSQQEPERRSLERRFQEPKKIVWMCVEFGGRQTTKGTGPK